MITTTIILYDYDTATSNNNNNNNDRYHIHDNNNNSDQVTATTTTSPWAGRRVSDGKVFENNTTSLTRGLPSYLRGPFHPTGRACDALVG